MLAITQFLESAKTLSLDEFCAMYPGHFFLKRPRRGKRPAEETSFGFETVAVNVDFDPYADEWRIALVAKRAGNPFPERMTVGRANNSDILLRVPSISKVHAHILREADGSFSLHDNHAANRTYHQHRPLTADATQKLAVGDAVGFASLDVEFVDSARLYRVLCAELLTPSKVT